MTKSQYLKPERLDDLAANIGSTYRPALVEAARSYTDTKGVKRARKEVKKWLRNRQEGQQARNSPFLQFCADHRTEGIRYPTVLY